MDLNYGSEYKEFTEKLKKFCKKYSGVHFSDSSKIPLSESFRTRIVAAGIKLLFINVIDIA